MPLREQFKCPGALSHFGFHLLRVQSFLLFKFSLMFLNKLVKSLSMTYFQAFNCLFMLRNLGLELGSMCIAHYGHLLFVHRQCLVRVR